MVANSTFMREEDICIVAFNTRHGKHCIDQDSTISKGCIQPIGCPGEHVGHGQSEVVGDWTHGPGCDQDACLRGWDWEGKTMIVDW